MTLLVIIAAACVGTAAYVLYRRSHSQEYPEMCETCGKALKFSDAYFVTEVFNDDARLGADMSMGGGTAMQATYCKSHYPKDAHAA